MCKFPGRIEVRIEKDGKDSYFLAQDAAEDNIGEDGDKVAIYQLIDVKVLRIRKSLEAV
jgi:hypothetical protein